jgi:hypothetical protein
MLHWQGFWLLLLKAKSSNIGGTAKKRRAGGIIHGRIIWNYEN